MRKGVEPFISLWICLRQAETPKCFLNFALCISDFSELVFLSVLYFLSVLWKFIKRTTNTTFRWEGLDGFLFICTIFRIVFSFGSKTFISFRLSSQVFIHSCVGPHTWIDNCVLRATLLDQFKGDVSLNGCSFVFSTNKCAYQFPWTDMGGKCLILESFL